VDHIIATLTLNTIAAFVIPFERAIEVYLSFEL
jgi:hypothetical protein